MNSSVILYKNKYFIGGLFIYIVALLYLHLVFQLPLTAFLEVFFIVGISFSCIAWVLTKNFAAPFHFPVIKKEGWLLLILVAWIAFYITYGGDLINKLIFKTWLNNPGLAKIIIFLKKLAVFVFIPFTVYKSLGFTLKDFGLKNNDVKFSDKKSILVLVVLSIAVLLFQYFLGNGSKPLRAGQFSSVQLLTALPLCFAYLLLDAGLIEEFFFRGLLQSRLSVVLKSPVGGIICTALIFGLVHAPGLFLRGAESEGMEEQMPFLFWAAYTIVYMSIAGIFLGIVYNKTKNLWIVIMIHAMLDLLANFPDFVHTWHL